MRPCRDTARTGENPDPHTQPQWRTLWDHPGAQGWHVAPPCSLSPSTCKSGTLQCHAEPGCRADGGWSPWGPWSPCSPGCQAGTQLASRQCNNPTPQLGGRGCSGHSQRQRPCPATEGCPGGGCGAAGGHGGHRVYGGRGVDRVHGGHGMCAVCGVYRVSRDGPGVDGMHRVRGVHRVCDVYGVYRVHGVQRVHGMWSICGIGGFEGAGTGCLGWMGCHGVAQGGGGDMDGIG